LKRFPLEWLIMRIFSTNDKRSDAAILQGESVSGLEIEFHRVRSTEIEPVAELGGWHHSDLTCMVTMFRHNHLHSM